MKKLWKYYEKKNFYLILLLSIVIGLNLTVLRILMAKIINNINQFDSNCILLIFLFIVINVVQVFVKYINDKKNYDMGLNLTKKVMISLLNKLKSFSLSHFLYKENRETVNRYEHVIDNIDKKVKEYSQTITNTTTIIGILVIIMLYDKFIFTIVVGYYGIITYFSLKTNKLTMNFWQKYIDKMKLSNFYSKILLDKAHSYERKVFKYEEFFNEKFLESFNNGSESNKNAGKKRLFFDVIIDFVTSLFLIFVLVIGWIRYSQNIIDIGIMFIIFDSTLTLKNLYMLEFSNWQKNKDTSIIERDLLLLLIGNDDVDNINILDSFYDDIRIEFINVSYKYPNSNSGIFNFNYIFESNKNYVIVGENGAGKTTLAKILMGLIDDYSGQVLINNYDMRKLSNKCKEKLFSVMFQKPSKYNLTIKENIFFNDNVENFDINIDSDMKEYIEKLPDKWDTVISNDGFSGIDISGGQWQKIFFARCSNSKSCISILDEPTASLDPIAEVNLYTNLIKLLDKKINIVISHRLGITKYMDEIILLENGRLVEFGSHNELINKGGKYYGFYESQRKYYI